MVEADVVVGLDLGMTKSRAVVAQRERPGYLKIIGVGVSPSGGLRKGVVVDVERTVQSITAATEEAAVMSGFPIRSVCAGVAGEHIRSLDSRGAIAVAGQEQEITAADRERVVVAARTVAIPFDREVLHVTPQEFAVDELEGIRDPIGMTGVRLEASVHIVTAAVTSVQNICRSIQRAGIEVNHVMLESLACARAALAPDESELGVCVVNIGGSTTDVAIFSKGSVRRTAVIGMGGQSVTNDVAICLRTSWPRAEQIKQAHGGAIADVVDAEDMVPVPCIAGREPEFVSRKEVAQIIEARMEEILQQVASQIRACGGGSTLGAGVVLTGGGAQLSRCTELAERVLGLPVRVGGSLGLSGLSDMVAGPEYCAAVGLVHLAADSLDLDEGIGARFAVRRNSRSAASDSRLETATGRMKEWFQTFM